MARNKYDDAHGVVRMRWEHGEPSSPVSGQLFVCEVWRASTRLLNSEPTKPRINVEARQEVRMWADGAWKTVGWNGVIRQSEPGEVRRHTRLFARNHYMTVTLDGWS